jgi:hypothetical protein
VVCDVTSGAGGCGFTIIVIKYQGLVIKFVAERKNTKIIMAKCNSDSKMQAKEIKLEKESTKEMVQLFEGECCALSYGDDDDWFDDEDEEFVFDPKGSNKWFEDALEAGLKEREEMCLIPKRKDEDDEKNTVVINIIFQ